MVRLKTINNGLYLKKVTYPVWTYVISYSSVSTVFGLQTIISSWKKLNIHRMLLSFKF